MNSSAWQPARIIPVAGIGSEREAEARATSALLAVLSAVRPFSKAILDRLGASRAQSADVQCFIEPAFDWEGRRIRPDGLIRVVHGSKVAWTALVEVKTGPAALTADQINLYWDIARDQGFDAVLTISNEIAAQLGVHPTSELKVRKNSRVQVHHYSWTYILTEALIQKTHRGVEDREQAWILSELIRYLEHPASGALSFDDMGPSWTTVRDDAHRGTLVKSDDGLTDVAGRWVQLLRFVALKLGAEIGEDVQPVWSQGRTFDTAKQVAAIGSELLESGALSGVLRVPKTAGDIELYADLRSRLLTASLSIDAPQDRGARGQITWLVKQLKDAPVDVSIEVWPHRARTPVATASLLNTREDRSVLYPANTKAARFRVVVQRPLGLSRKSGGRKQGFIDSLRATVDEFYERVVQNLVAWQPPAPRKSSPGTELDQGVTVDDVPEPAMPDSGSSNEVQAVSLSEPARGLTYQPNESSG